jgi:uncharacterized protein
VGSFIPILKITDFGGHGHFCQICFTFGNINFTKLETTNTPTLGNGKICYVQIPATDIPTSAAFYHRVFGWEIRIRGDGSTAFDDGVGQVSGAWVSDRKPSTEPATEIGMIVYIMVDDAVETLKTIVAQGGKLIQPIGKDAPEITALFSDPIGNVWGLYQERG